MASSTESYSAPVLSATLTSSGEIALPIEVRRALGLSAGDELLFEPAENGFRIVAARDSSTALSARAAGAGCAAAVAFGRELRGNVE